MLLQWFPALLVASPRTTFYKKRIKYVIAVPSCFYLRKRDGQNRNLQYKFFYCHADIRLRLVGRQPQPENLMITKCLNPSLHNNLAPVA